MSNDTTDGSKPILKRDTYTCLHYHIVFATYCRRRLITRDWRPRVHAYIAGVLRKLGAVPLIVGGVSDHVHILTGLRPNHRLSDVMREVKHESSRWVHENHRRDFGWQKGYAAFTVSPLACEKVRQYIAGQEEHHNETLDRGDPGNFVARLAARIPRASPPF